MKFTTIPITNVMAVFGCIVQLRIMINKTRSSATAKSTACPTCLLYCMTFIGRQSTDLQLINHFYVGVIGHEISYRIRRNNAK